MKKLINHLDNIIKDGGNHFNPPKDDLPSMANWIESNAVAIFRAEKALEVKQFLEVYSGIKQDTIIAEFASKEGSKFSTSYPIGQLRYQAHQTVIMECLKYFALL